MALSPEAIAAIVGAGVGLAGSAGIEVVKSVFSRRKRAKAIKVALYYEIFQHNIVEVGASPQGDPNFLVLGFSRDAYEAYLPEIPDLLPADLVGAIYNYYAQMSVASSQQALIEDDGSKSREIAAELARLQIKVQLTAVPIHPDELQLLQLEGHQVADRLSKMMQANRVMLILAVERQKSLLAVLLKAFKNNPSNVPLAIAGKHRDWMEKTIKSNLPPETPSKGA